MRKTIGVCVTGYDFEYETRIVSGIHAACQENDINLLVFATLLRKPGLLFNTHYSDNVIHCETEIFKLINYDELAGLIILGDSFITPDETFEALKSAAAEHHIPTINISDPKHHADTDILLSDRIAMEFVIEHLVSDHGLRRINFIGGFTGNLETEERLAAYKKILTKYNIPIEEKRIGYGQFWVKSMEIAREFVSGPREEWPEAIACANDTMAIFVMDTFKELGIRVPEDIVVTGFDGIADGEFSKPKLTTVKRAFATAGKRAVYELMDIWNGKEIEKTIFVDSELITRESCGCKPKGFDDENFLKKYEVKNTFTEFNTYILKMNSNFGNVEDSKELYLDVAEGAKHFKLRQMFLCLRSDLENDQTEDSINEDMYNMPKNVISMVEYGHDIPIGTEFESRRLIPIELLNREKPVFYAFSSMYFKDTYLGYIAYEPSDMFGISGDLFATWVFQISNNAGSFYMKNKLQYVVNKLVDLNERDPLTGLFNRRGMNHYKALVAKAVKAGEIITVVCADVDNLKKTNDNYGHEGGDTVIMRCALAIREALPTNAICVRTGGDEFSAVFSHSDTVNVGNMIKKIDHLLADFNENSGLPYKAGCSCGYVSKSIKDTEEITDMLKEADDRMYEIKTIKKTVRKD